MVIQGYTNNLLKKTSLFGGGIVESDECLEELNQISVSFCSLKRHQKCSRSGKCDRSKPNCHYDRLDMVGKSKYAGEELTKKDREKIKKIIKDCYKKCKPVTVRIEHI